VVTASLRKRINVSSQSTPPSLGVSCSLANCNRDGENNLEASSEKLPALLGMLDKESRFVLFATVDNGLPRSIAVEGTNRGCGGGILSNVNTRGVGAVKLAAVGGFSCDIFDCCLVLNLDVAPALPVIVLVIVVAVDAVSNDFCVAIDEADAVISVSSSTSIVGAPPSESIDSVDAVSIILGLVETPCKRMPPLLIPDEVLPVDG
jgi:hypothetical protein